ncbi:4-alpha-L-fucosyltransferase [Clostridium puniceum]|uniref:4-alpha-L-fucosyltransferase n=1 Tax=Clostridium puniceum TaxID=29367 RepID=A0A1S8TJH3_9CLOT|nr:TDP-N-acetylfucosamine:lipid II N-acetylfucosaminyltransferase [Clostridium puniceum]OOM77943.1 4-alpha-L-fucosyltransferase [Clostridium puniceum]
MKKKKVVMFGASKMGEAAYALFKDRYNISYFCDNDGHKWGKNFCGLRVISPESLKNEEFENTMIIITSIYHKEIMKQLIDMQISDIEIFSYESNGIKQMYSDANFIQNVIDKIYDDNNDKYNLHIMIDNFYCRRFIEFTNENFNPREHKFIILTYEPIKFVDNINGYENTEVINIGKYTELRLCYYIKESSKVFIHYLTDYICEFICDYNIDRYTEINWILWGGDLYGYIDSELYDEKTKEFIQQKCKKSSYFKSFGNNEYRKKCISKLKNVLAIEGDYRVLKKHFNTNAEFKNFIYPNPVNFEKLDKINYIEIKNNQFYNLKSKYKYIILLGNSGTPENNHLDILYELKYLKLESFCVICPLSYGDETYINEIIKAGKEILGEKFIPLEDFLQPEEYFNLLKFVDIGIMNHNRQQGVGNILALAYLQKKLFIKDNITTNEMLTGLGVKLFDIKEIKNINKILMLNLDKNEKSILENFGKESILRIHKEIY